MSGDPLGEIAGGAQLDLLDPFRMASVFDQVQSQLFNTRRAPFRVARYRVLDRLGQGGCGVVYRGVDPELRREVAIKLIPLDVRVTRETKRAGARLVQEARALASISHPHVVCVYDVGTWALPTARRSDRSGSHAGGVFVAMELIDGPTLGDWIDEAPRSSHDVIARFVDAARGLAAAHEVGIVHGDFKPSNVMIGADARLRVLDFGLARSSRRDPPSCASSQLEPTRSCGMTTRTGTVFGTPVYMSPEQHRGEPLCPASDQYSLCVALFHALCGAYPFAGCSIDEMHRRKASETIARIPEGRATPAGVLDVIRRGLRADPRRRFPTMDALVHALLRAGRTAGRRRATRLAAVAVAGLTTAGLGGAGLAEQRREDSCATEAAAIHDVWNDTRSPEIARALAETSPGDAPRRWTRVRARLDAYTEEWASLRAEVCHRAEIERSLREPLARAARGCLDEHRAGLESLLEQLGSPHEEVARRATIGTAMLPRASECIDELRLARAAEMPADPAADDLARVLRARLAWAAATGDETAELQAARAGLREASALPNPHLATWMRVSVADAARKVGRYEEAVVQLERAYLDATAQSHDGLALRAATRLVSVLGSDLGRPEDALEWVAPARMLAARLGEGDTYVRAKLQIAIANVHEARGANVEALAARREALPIIERELGSSALRAGAPETAHAERLRHGRSRG